MLSPWDRWLALRAAAIASITVVFTLLVVAATDEGAPWAARVGMTAALAPIAGSLGAFTAIRVAAGRGELRALAAIGADPARAVLGAILGGALLAALGPVLAAMGAADLGGLFPRPVAARWWVAAGGGMTELTQGLRIEPGGALALVAASKSGAPPLPAGSIQYAVLALFVAAIGGPLWAAAATSWGRGAEAAAPWRLLAGVGALVFALVAFQAVAAGRISPAALLVAPLFLLLDGAAARSRTSRAGAAPSRHERSAK